MKEGVVNATHGIQIQTEANKAAKKDACPLGRFLSICIQLWADSSIDKLQPVAKVDFLFGSAKCIA